MAGAQTAFSLKTYGDILYAGIASSGVVDAQLSYPQWSVDQPHLQASAYFFSRYDPIQKFAPQDCVSRINAIVDKIDSLIAKNNTKAIQQLKNIFGLGELEDLRDFAMTIAFPRPAPM